ncbi:hypothetical protein QD460_34675, partial [Rhizobium jaguaris]
CAETANSSWMSRSLVRWPHRGDRPCADYRERTDRADVVASLKRRGRYGHIIHLSARSSFARAQPAGQEALGDLVTEPAMTASRLLRHVRTADRKAEAKGLSWHCVLDAVRLQGQEVWAALPMAERRPIARHVRPFWDVHRFRIRRRWRMSSMMSSPAANLRSSPLQ